MFFVTPNAFDERLALEKRVSNDIIKKEYIRYFDNDGFELSHLEQIYYKENGVQLDSCLNHSCDQKKWIEGGDDHFILDHSLLLQRRNFAGEAKAQLEYKRKEYPQLNKYLNLVPKWGLDFALEYYNDNAYIEVIHIENDYRSLEVAKHAKENLEKKIIETDWVDFVKTLIRRKSKWDGLVGFAQNDWKAKYWGLNRAENTEKSFS